MAETEDLLERERSTKEKHAISLIGKENVLNERMRATIAEHDEQIAELKKLVATIQADKDESKKCSHAKLEELHKKNKDDVMDAVNSFQLRIEEEQHKFDALRFHLQTKETNVKQRLEELSTKHVRVLEELQASYEQRLGVLESQHQDISDEISSLKHKHITYDQDMEEMLSDEISDICYKYEVQLKQERDTTAANQRDLDATRATFEALVGKFMWLMIVDRRQ